MSIKISELGNLTTFTDTTYFPVVNTSTVFDTVKSSGATLKQYVLGTVVTDLANTSANVTTLQSDIVTLTANALSQTGLISNTSANVTTLQGNIVTLTANALAQTGLIANITNGTATFGNLVPSANVTYDLGSSTQRWKDLYLSGNTIYMGDTTISITGGKLVAVGASFSPPTGAVGFIDSANNEAEIDLPSIFANLAAYGYTVNLSSYSSAPIVWDGLRNLPASRPFVDEGIVKFASGHVTINATGKIDSVSVDDPGFGYDLFPFAATDPAGYAASAIGGQSLFLIPTTAADLGNVIGYIGPSFPSLSTWYTTVGLTGNVVYTWTGNTGSTVSFTMWWNAPSSPIIHSLSYTPALPAGLTTADLWYDYLADYYGVNWATESNPVTNYFNDEALPFYLTYDYDTSSWSPNTVGTLTGNVFRVELGTTTINSTATLANPGFLGGETVYWKRGLSADTGIGTAGDLIVAGDVKIAGDLYVSPASIFMGNLTMSASAGGNLQVNGNQVFTPTLANSTPASAGATGTKGDIKYDSSYIYLCVATNTWIRAARVAW